AAGARARGKPAYPAARRARDRPRSGAARHGHASARAPDGTSCDAGHRRASSGGSAARSYPDPAVIEARGHRGRTATAEIIVSFFILSLLIQAGLIVHVIKTGRNTLWIWAIALLPAAGSAAYVVVELLPGL